MIKRAKRKSGFTIIGNHAFNNENLKFDDIGILCYILSKPDDWTVSVKELWRSHGISKHKTYASLRNLMAEGYVKRVQFFERDGNRITSSSIDYEFYDDPIPAAERTPVSDSKDSTIRDSDSRDPTERDSSGGDGEKSTNLNQELNKQNTPLYPPKGESVGVEGEKLEEGVEEEKEVSHSTTNYSGEKPEPPPVVVDDEGKVCGFKIPYADIKMKPGVISIAEAAKKRYGAMLAGQVEKRQDWDTVHSDGYSHRDRWNSFVEYCQKKDLTNIFSVSKPLLPYQLAQLKADHPAEKIMQACNSIENRSKGLKAAYQALDNYCKNGW